MKYVGKSRKFVLATAALAGLMLSPMQANAQMESGPSVSAKPGTSAPPRATMQREVGFKKAAVNKPQGNNIKPDANMFRQEAAKIVADKTALDRTIEGTVKAYKELGQAHKFYADAYKACTSKTYSPTEQKQAGCTNNDNYGTCATKLVSHCSKNQLVNLEQKAGVAKRAHDNLGEKLMRYGMNYAK